LKTTLKTMAICLAMTLIASTAALAQTTHSLSLYGVGFQIDGTASVGDVTTTVDVDVDEFIDSLEIGGLAGYRLQTPKWSLVVDGAFMGLGQSKDGRSMDVDMTVLELDAGYRFSETVEAFLGVRYTDLTAEVATSRPISGEPVQAKSDDEFFDPIVGLRVATPLSDAWVLQGQADVGGFGVGMDLQWQAKLELGWRPSDSATIWLGYRALNQDFDDAGDRELFAMDVTYQGPELGVTFTF
jgi:hypothetical protein